MSFCWKDRQAAIDSCASGRPAELLIIGGGVVGCSIAAHAAMLGLDCVLIELEDFGSGASGNSTGLAHAGLRYLAQGRVGYVLREARERLLLERLAPHWVKPFPFLFPVYRDDPFGLCSIRIGTLIYQLLYRLAAWGTGAGVALPYRVVTPEELLRRVPGLAPEGLCGGTEYFVDAQLADTRFTFGFARKAAELGARIINHAGVIELTEQGDRLTGAVVRDELTGARFTVRASQIINAAGAWIDGVRNLAGLSQPILSNSRGVHLVVDRIADDPLILTTQVPGQVFFVVPMDRRLSLIGTTDTPSTGSPDARPELRHEAVELVGRLLRFFPDLRLPGESVDNAAQRYANQHIRGIYWGLRPLVRQNASTLDASREHRLVREANGLWSVPGVKLTAARAAGEGVARAAWEVLRAISAPRCVLDRLPGAGVGQAADKVQGFPLANGVQSEAHLAYLERSYGSLYLEVLRWADSDARYRTQVLQDEPWIYAEVAYAAQQELVMTLNDFLWRRTRWARLRTLPEPAVRRIAEILGDFLRWTDHERGEQIEAYRRELAGHRLECDD